MPTLARLRDDDAGLTLVELLVTMAVLSTVMGVIASSVIMVQQTVSRTSQRQADLGQARIALDAASADLRTLTPLVDITFPSVGPREIVFYANRDLGSGGTPVRLRWTLEGDELVRYETRGPSGLGSSARTTDYPAAPTRRRVVARGVQPGSTVFRYFTELSPSADEVDPATADVDRRRRIRFVRITVTAENAGEVRAGVAGTTVTQTVRLPNLIFLGS